MISTGRRGIRFAALAAVLVIAGLMSVWASSTKAQPSPCSPGVDCENGMSVSDEGPAAMGAEVDVDVSIDYANTGYLGLGGVLKYENTIVEFVPVGTKGVIYTGLGGMISGSVAFDIDAGGGYNVTKFGAYDPDLIAATDTGVAVIVRYKCIGEGTATLTLVPPEVAIDNSTMLGSGAVRIPTELKAGSVTCGGATFTPSPTATGTPPTPTITSTATVTMTPAATSTPGAADEYFIYSSYDPPGISDVVAAGGYVEYYGIPEWGDEIQHVYFLSGTVGYKVRVWVTDGDGDGVVEPRQHPDHYLSAYQGPLEPRHFEIVSSADLAGYTSGSGSHTEEFHIDSSGVYLGAYPNGIHKWDHDWNYLEKVANAPPARTESLAYNAADNVWYAGGRTRTIYELSDTDTDGSFLDESWVPIFTYPTYGGSHHDGMEYVGCYLWISDMTSDVIGKWEYDPASGTWVEVNRFTYGQPGDVEGMGFGPNDHFWIGSGWGSGSYIYELGNEITRGYPIANAGLDVEAHPPTVPVEFDASGSHHTDVEKEIVLYEWDFESDGTWDYSGTDLVVEHTYPAYYRPDGSIDWDETAKDYTASLRVTDNSDPPLLDTDTRIIHIAAPPWKPVADADGPYQGSVGTPISLDGSGSLDPESVMFAPDHPWYETIATYEWDLDYDGEFDDSTGVAPSWTWESEGIYIVGLRVTDSQGSGPGGTIGPLDVDVAYATVVVEECPDSDGDGICDDEDACPNEPEDFDGFQDEDGCPEGDFSFAIITDLHIGRADYLEDRLERVVQWLNENWCAEWIDSECVERNFDFVALLGDISEDGDLEALRDGKHILDDLNPNVPYVPLIGNHDVSGNEEAAYALNFESVFADQFEELSTKPGFRNVERDGTAPLYLQNSSFLYREVRFVGLDFVTRARTAKPTLHPATLDWLELELRGHSGKPTPVILLAHHPLLTNAECINWYASVFPWWVPYPVLSLSCGLSTFSSWDIDKPFTTDDLSGTIETFKRDNPDSKVVGFGGHLHGFPWFEHRGSGASVDMPIFNANYTKENTFAGVPVVVTEAVMVGSNQNLGSGDKWKDFIRIVKVGNETVTYQDEDMDGHLLAALNPDFNWSRPSPELKLCQRGPSWFRIWVPCGLEGWRLEVDPDPYSGREWSRCEWDFAGAIDEEASECGGWAVYPDRQERVVCLTLTSKDDTTVVETACRTVWRWVP